MHRINIELENRILVLDGAMGTMIQTYELTEADFRTPSLAHHSSDLKGNNELLNLTRPEIIKQIHLQYLQAGADIIETNTFNGNRISQADYHTAHLVYDLNYYGAIVAREAVNEYVKTDASRPRFVAGAMGPTTRLASISPDVNNPAFRNVTFDQLVEAFTEQAKALMDGGVDLFLLETVTDTLNVKAALFALMQLFEETGKQLPIMVSGTITDASGRILSGQMIEAFLISISHAPLLSVGLNCALGAAELRPYVQELARESPFNVSVHPNAGLPNEFGGYDQTPEEIATLLAQFAKEGWINIVGGCCGTTPEHIRAIAKAVENYPPRKRFFNTPPTEVEEVDRLTNTISWEDILVQKTNNDTSPTYTIKEMLSFVSTIADEASFKTVKTFFEKEKSLYHPEQVMLIEAHLFGRYTYLQTKKSHKRQEKAPS